jgi:serine/threonine protein kinase
MYASMLCAARGPRPEFPDASCPSTELAALGTDRIRFVVGWTRYRVPAPPTQMHDPPNELLEQAHARVGRALCGKYRVDRLIGIGGMAAVFEGTHLRNANRVALKILHRDFATQKDMRARFLREGYAANSVGHPGAVRVLDDDKADDGSIFLVMELLEGETLDARFAKSADKLGVSEVVSLAIDVLDVLAAAHGKGIVHRDIKPENLFLTREGEVKLLDFGIARLRTTSPSVTGRGDWLGTPAFMSPEQALGRVAEVDAQSDVWAVGATAFMLLSGRYVHEGATSSEMIVRRGSLPAPLLASLAPHVPQAIAAVFDRALAFAKADRWPSAKAMRDALAEARGDAAPVIDEQEPEERTKLAPLAPLARAAARDHASASTVAAPAPDPVSTTVAGVVTNGESQRSRVRRTRMALIIGAASAAVLVLLVALSSARSTASTAAVGPSTASQPPIEPAADTPAPGAPGPTPSRAGSGGATPWMPVETLPKESDPAPSSPRSSPRPSAHAYATAPAASATAVHRKHDPLSPW